MRSGLGKDPQVVATAAARRFLGDRLIRVVDPARTARSERSGGRPGGCGGPLIAVRLHVLTRKTLGGLETDLDGRVADGRRLAASRGCTPSARRPDSAAAACTATAPWKERSSAAACSPAVRPGGRWPPPSVASTDLNSGPDVRSSRC